MTITVQQLKQVLNDLPEWDDEATRDKNVIYIPIENGGTRTECVVMFTRNQETKFWEVAI